MDLRKWNSFSRDEQLIIKAQRRPRNDDELYEYIKNTWGITLPRKAHCPKCTAPFKIFADAYFARYPCIILRGARGCGKSALLALLSLTEQVTLNNYVMILGASETQSKIVFSYLSQRTSRFPGKFWEYKDAPRALQEAKEELVGQSKIITGGLIRCMAASPTSVYGQRPIRLRMDEVDLMDEELIASAIPCCHPFGDIKENILMSSTSYTTDGTLANLIKQYEKVNEESLAEGGDIIVPVYTYCYKDVLQTEDNPDGFITPEQLKRMKAMVTSEVWERQYENNDPLDDDCVFTSEEIEVLFDNNLLGYNENGEPNEALGNPGPKNVVLLDEKYWKLAEYYYHGADWGDRVDWTVISSFAISYDRNKPDILFRFGKYGRWGLTKSVSEYNVVLQTYEGVAAHDGTGNGQFVRETLDEFSEEIKWTRQNKEQGLNKLIEAIKNGKIRMPNIKALKDAFKGLTNEHVSGKKHLADEVASVMMAWCARQRILLDTDGFCGGMW